MLHNWKECLLGDVITFQRGFDLPNRNRRDGTVPIVSSSGISGYHNEAKVKGPGVVTGRYGTLGEVFFIPHDFWPLNTTLYTRDFKGNDPLFISYFLKTLDFAHHNAAGAVPGINRNALHLIPVRIPNLISIQRRIAAILSAYDDLIENNARRIAILEEMARNLYREWFVEFRFPGHEGVRVVDGVPEGWEVKRLSALVETQYGYTESANELQIGPKFLRGMDINKSTYIQWDKVPYCSISAENYKKFKVEYGDIFVIRMADPGKVGIVERETDAVFASYLIRLRITYQQLKPYYLFYFLLSDKYQDYVTGASTGTTRKSASASIITHINIFIPPADILASFEEQTVGIRALINHLLNKTTNLRHTRDLLLPKLISGELDVSDLDIVGAETTDTADHAHA